MNVLPHLFVKNLELSVELYYPDNADIFVKIITTSGRNTYITVSNIFLFVISLQIRNSQL